MSVDDTTYDFNELLMARKLGEAKILSKREQEEETDQNALMQTASSAFEIAEKQNKLTAVKEGMKVGTSLRRKMQEEGMTTDVFITLLIITSLKESIDLLSGGFLGWLAWIFCSLVLLIVYFGKGLQRLLRKRVIKIFLAIFIEAIPIVQFIPAYLIMLLWTKHDCDKAVKKAKAELEEHEMEMEKLKKS